MSKRSITALHLALLVVLTVVKSLVWLTILPPFQIADEPAHFDNIQYRAERGTAPTYTGKSEWVRVLQDGASAEVRLLWYSTIPKNYFRASHDTEELPQQLRELARIPDMRQTDGQDPALNYPGGYYRSAVPFYSAFRTSSVVTRIIAIRCLSLLFGLCAVVATYFAARLIIADPLLALVAALVVSLQPMLSQMTVAVNNDAAVIGYAALVFYFQIRALSELQRLPRVSTIGGLLASSALLYFTKPTGYGILPGAGVVFMAIAFVHRRDRRVQIACALAIVGAAVVLFRNGAEFRALLPGNTDEPGPHGQPDFWSFLDTLDRSYLDYLLRSTWGQFGWLDYSMNGDWVARLRLAYEVVFVGTLVAGATYVLRDLDRTFWFRGRLWGYSIATTIVGVIFILYVEHRFRLTGAVGVIQGRNFLFALPAFAIWMVVAIVATVPERMRKLSAALIVVGAMMLNAAGLFTILRHHYAS